MEKIKDPHDRYFKSMMSRADIAKEFFLEHLPSWLLDEIDLDTLQICQESFLNRFLKLLKTDVLYQVCFRHDQGFLFLHNEHQSTPERFLPFRKLQYAVEIMANFLDRKKQDYLPIVVPIVFYHGKMKYGYSTDLFDGFRHKELAQRILFQRFFLISTHDLSDQQLMSKPTTAHAFEWLHKHIYEPNFEPYLDDFITLLKNPKIYQDKDVISLSLRYFANSANLQHHEKSYSYIENQLSQAEGFDMGTLANWFREKGVKEGLLQGIEQGMQKGIEQGMHQGIQKGMEQGIHQGMHQGMHQGIQTGMKQGISEASQKIAINLLKINMEPHIVARATDLPLQKIHEIQQMLEEDKLDA